MSTTSPNSAKSPQPAPRTLVVTQAGGGKYVLPYGHFLGAELTACEKNLTLHFAMHTVLVEGSGLAPLLNKLSELRLPALASTPNGAVIPCSIKKVEVIIRSEGVENFPN